MYSVILVVLLFICVWIGVEHHSIRCSWSTFVGEINAAKIVIFSLSLSHYGIYFYVFISCKCDFGACGLIRLSWKTKWGFQVHFDRLCCFIHGSEFLFGCLLVVYCGICWHSCRFLPCLARVFLRFPVLWFLIVIGFICSVLNYSGLREGRTKP